MKPYSMRYVVFFLCALGYSFQLKAQRETSVWNFGNLAGMDFSTVPPAAITTSAINSYEGSASISDSNGRLIAYSNGLDVYNRENNLMQNGDNLVGDTNATHACIFLKQPLSERFYYLFTCSSDDIPGINYSVIDMQADNGNGAVIQKNIPLLASNSEKLAATYADNGQDIWLATMGPYNSDSLFLYKLTPLGLEPPVIHKLNYLIEKQGQIKFSRNGKLLAITSYGEGVLLLSFNAADGSISNERFINRGPLPNHTEQIYGLEFSPGYKYLYVALRRATAVYQCPLSAFSGSITTACTNINTTGYEFCQLQLGPDLKIYATSPGNAFLGCITRPDEPDTTCRLDANNIYLQGKQAREGLPSFLVSYFNIPDIRLTQTCLTDTTLIRFNLLADSIQWDLGDGNLVTTHNNTADSVLSYIYPNAQEYKIKATMFFSGDIDSASETVLIRHAKKPDLGHDTSFCHGDSLLLTYSDSVTTYLWQNGSTDSSIYVLDSGLYWLEVRDAFGCFSADTIQVDEVEFPNT